jgi:LPXTG-motif cell wall-anchored protein
VPSVCRRIVVLLVVALLGVGGVSGSVSSSALAQGAGDQQYEDPLGSSDSGSDDSSGSGTNNGNLEPLSPSPQTSDSGSNSSSGSPSSSGATSGSAGTSATGTTTSSAAAPTLPNTGIDTRVLLLAGAVLLLVGVGLRMRNAPERF